MSQSWNLSAVYSSILKVLIGRASLKFHIYKNTRTIFCWLLWCLQLISEKLIVCDLKNAFNLNE
jgi:hypothetical protein